MSESVALRLAPAAAACDVPAARAAAAAGGGGRGLRARRPAAALGSRAGQGRGGRGLRARQPPAAPCRRPRLPLPGPAGPGRAAPPAALPRPALLQPSPLEPPLRARYVEAVDPRNKCTAPTVRPIWRVFVCVRRSSFSEWAVDGDVGWMVRRVVRVVCLRNLWSAVNFASSVLFG